MSEDYIVFRRSDFNAAVESLNDGDSQFFLGLFVKANEVLGIDIKPTEETS